MTTVRQRTIERSDEIRKYGRTRKTKAKAHSHSYERPESLFCCPISEAVNVESELEQKDWGKFLRHCPIVDVGSSSFVNMRKGPCETNRARDAVASSKRVPQRFQLWKD